VLGLKFDGGVIIACDTLGSYGSLARFRQISRMLRVNDTTVMGVGGDYADFQFIKAVIEAQVSVSHECVDDGVKYTPRSLYNWLTRVFYSRRSKINPLWNTVLVGGLVNDQPFLGYVDKLGVAYEAPSIASGYGAYIAQPMMRSALEKKGLLTEAEARELIARCMTVLFYRDARSGTKYEVAVVKRGAVAHIEAAVPTKSSWEIAHSVGGYE